MCIAVVQHARVGILATLMSFLPPLDRSSFCALGLHINICCSNRYRKPATVAGRVLALLLVQHMLLVCCCAAKSAILLVTYTATNPACHIDNRDNRNNHTDPSHLFGSNLVTTMIAHIAKHPGHAPVERNIFCATACEKPGWHYESSTIYLQTGACPGCSGILLREHAESLAQDRNAERRSGLAVPTATCACSPWADKGLVTCLPFCIGSCSGWGLATSHECNG